MSASAGAGEAAIDPYAGLSEALSGIPEATLSTFREAYAAFSHSDVITRAGACARMRVSYHLLNSDGSC